MAVPMSKDKDVPCPEGDPRHRRSQNALCIIRDQISRIISDYIHFKKCWSVLKIDSAIEFVF